MFGLLTEANNWLAKNQDNVSVLDNRRGRIQHASKLKVITLKKVYLLLPSA